MTDKDQEKKYQDTLREFQKRDPEIDLVLDITAEDTDWLRVARRGVDPQRPHDSKT